MPDDSNASRRSGRRSSRTDADLQPTDDPVVEPVVADAPDPVDGTADPTPIDEATAEAPAAEIVADEATAETAAIEDASQADDARDPTYAEATPANEDASETAATADDTPAGADATDDPTVTPSEATYDRSAEAPLDDWTAEEVLADRDAMTPTATLWAPVATIPAEAEPAAWLPWLQARSPDATICPFLRAVGDDDSLGFPIEAPDALNRCDAMREPVPQSLRQQELVCLTAAHINCPRYLRGATVVNTVATPRVRTKAILTPAISASLIILALSFGASVAFGLANGGLVLPSSAIATPAAPPPSASAVAAAPSTRATTAPSVVPSPSGPVAAATASAAPSASASVAPTPSATPAPSATPKATAKPAATPKPPTPRSAQLKRCPDKPNCWIYTVRSGDNLFSIAKYFGVSLSRVKSLNPWTETSSLRAGRKLILPNPTR